MQMFNWSTYMNIHWDTGEYYWNIRMKHDSNFQCTVSSESEIWTDNEGTLPKSTINSTKRFVKLPDMIKRFDKVQRAIGENVRV